MNKIIDGVEFIFCENQQRFSELFEYCRDKILSNAHDLKKRFPDYIYRTTNFVFPGFFFKFNSDDSCATYVLPASAYFSSKQKELDVLLKQYVEKEDYFAHYTKMLENSIATVTADLASLRHIVE